MALVFARRMDNLKASEIRELLKVTEKPGMISFAGGLPAPELFPVEEIKKITVKLLDEEGKEALQYSATEGFTPLRQKIAERMNVKLGTSLDYENILITCGSQQALDFTGKVFINEGDVILCESPTYLGAINAFKAYSPRFIEVPTDEDGMIIEELERILESTENVKFIYLIPDFQNPTGRTWSTERRRKLMDVVNRYEIPVIEDNPYGELRFEGKIPPSLKSMDSRGLVIFLGTFSKTFCPGLRIGWVAADKEVLEKYVLVKQGADLHTSSISQRKVVKFMDAYDLDGRIERIKSVYKRRRDKMIETMKKEFPKDVRYNCPEGGLFMWVELPSHMNAREFLNESIKNSVAFVPGGSFFPNGGRENTLRLNYSNMEDEKIVEGIKRLGAVLRKHMN